MTQRQPEQRALLDGEQRAPLPPAIAAQLDRGTPDVNTSREERPSAPVKVSDTVLAVAEAAGEMIGTIARAGTHGVGKHTPEIFHAFALLRHRMEVAEEALVAYAEAKLAERDPKPADPA